MESSAFYTMKGYELAADAQITTAMEDYLEMICRLEEEEAGPVRIPGLSQKLHVKPSSASKMVSNLREKGLVTAQKYGEIHLTDSGRALGSTCCTGTICCISFYASSIIPRMS